MALISIPGYSVIYAAPVILENALFVDSTVVAGSTYDHTTRSATGGTDTSFTTIQAAVNAMSSGDDIYIRGAVGGGTQTYLENVLISGSTVPDGTSGNWCSLQSYPGEWAKIDGQNNEHYTIGKSRNGRDDPNDLAYWRFERIEIIGGTDGIDGGAGLYISGGPFIVRYCYIHDCLAAGAGENPAGVSGYCWRDSVFEYNWVSDNGSTTSPDRNYANVAIIGDYSADRETTGSSGFDGDASDAINNNVWRYNYFNGSSVGWKVKGDQLLTGRNPGVADYDDTYITWGDHLHHNIVNGTTTYGMILAQDFAQCYQNIFTNVSEAIVCPHQPRAPLYKQGIYNNTIIDPVSKGVNRHGRDTDTFSTFDEDEGLYGFDYNNIIDQQPIDPQPDGSWFGGTAFNVYCGSDLSKPPYANPYITGYTCTNNYCYRPATTNVFEYLNNTYTQSQFEAQTETASPRVMYSKASSEGSDNLFTGASGADALITRGAHVLESGVTISNGGIGGNNPNLGASYPIPTFVGATDPSSTDGSAWVDGVLNDVSSVAWLKAQTIGSTPDWVE